MLSPSRSKRTTKTSANRKCLIPNEGGSGPAGSVVLDELVMESILTISVKLWHGFAEAFWRNISITLMWLCAGHLSEIACSNTQPMLLAFETHPGHARP
jgi:hypothetical protein